MSAVRTRPAPAEVGVKVGDFFYSSWGYDQTNVDFYKVVGVTKKGVKVQQWTSKAAGPVGGPSEAVVPGDGPATYSDWSAVTPEMDYWERQQAVVEKPVGVEQKFLTNYGTAEEPRVCFSVSSYANAYKWDGAPKHQTGSGWGH